MHFEANWSPPFVTAQTYRSYYVACGTATLPSKGQKVFYKAETFSASQL